MRHFFPDSRGNPIYEPFHQRRLRSRIGNYNQHQHQHHHSHHNHHHHSHSYLYHANRHASLHHHLPQARSTLFCLIQNRSWNEVIRRSQTHPTEVLEQDVQTGNTPLHMACRLDPPPDVVKALAVSSTSRMQNWDGATPCHIAASHRCSARALMILLDMSEAAPSSSRAYAASNATKKSGDDDTEDDDDEGNESVLSTLSRTGRAPIHYACTSFRGLELEAFKVLFEATLKHGNLRLQRQEQPNQDVDDDDDLDSCWIGEDDNVDSDEDSVVKDFREEQEIIRMMMGKDYDDAAAAKDDDTDPGKMSPEELQEQQRRASATDSSQVDQDQAVVVNVLGLKDATGQTPLGLLFRRYRERVRHVISRIDRIHDAANAAAQRDAVRRGSTSSNGSSSPQLGTERHRRAALVAALTVQGELGELWSKARWIVARLTQERLEREEDWKYYPGPKTTKTPAAATHPTAQAASKWAAEQCRSSFCESNPFQDEHSDFVVPVPQSRQQQEHNDMDQKVEPKKPSTASTAAPSRKFRIVHASVGLTGYGCPPEMIRLAISVHPHQVCEMDEDGQLPLHIACTASSHLVSTEEDSSNRAAVSDYLAASGAGASDDHSVLSDAMSFFSSATVSQTANPFDKVIKILLQHYPEAAQIPQGKSPGKLPLVLAMERQEQQLQRGGINEENRRTWEDGIRTLMNAHPPALHSDNRKHQLTPALFSNILALVAEDYMAEPFPSSSSSANRPPFRLLSSSRSGTLTLSLMQSRQQPQQRSSTSKLLRREACARTTIFELLRTKPDWLTTDKKKTDKARKL